VVYQLVNCHLGYGIRREKTFMRKTGEVLAFTGEKCINDVVWVAMGSNANL